MDDWYERYDAADMKYRNAVSRLVAVNVELAEAELALKQAERERSVIFREKNNLNEGKTNEDRDGASVSSPEGR